MTLICTYYIYSQQASSKLTVLNVSPLINIEKGRRKRGNANKSTVNKHFNKQLRDRNTLRHQLKVTSKVITFGLQGNLLWRVCH